MGVLGLILIDIFIFRVLFEYFEERVVLGII